MTEKAHLVEHSQFNILKLKGLFIIISLSSLSGLVGKVTIRQVLCMLVYLLNDLCAVQISRFRSCVTSLSSLHYICQF